MGPFVGVVEIVAGSLVLLGLLTRPAALVLLVNISVAIVSTKIPILLGHGFWVFTLPKLQRYGFWSMAHEARTDFCIWLGCLFLAIVGAGTLSVDGWLEARTECSPSSKANLKGEPMISEIPATTPTKDNLSSESKPE
jgi:putative oxidoreductase